ncbi:MAG: TonB-dependent receptor plug domain-containing protein, partial [Chitinophagaceae bacterium]|nr:TonB-dependent receptor plug domain-containing protein [Chitinophagaceae bacterium]
MSKLMTLCAMLLLFCATTFGQKGAFKLKVKDEDNLNLPGASVKLSPGNYSGTTNQYGEILIANIPSGEYTLSISYIGYGSVEKKIDIQPNGTELIETLSSKAVTGAEVVVMGDRLKGQARALNQQKNSDRVTNIISADQMGRFPDGNIGDAIKRVPGITMQNDQGEARNIIVRGMGPEFNSVTMNGERIPSAEGDNRRIQMDLIPTDMIQTVEVSKTLTADMDADAIGGSVNLITRTAPNGLRLSGTVAGGFNPIRDGFIGTANFIAGSRTANKKLGYVVSGSFNRNDFGSDNLEAAWAKDANGKLYINDHDLRIYDVIRVRRSVTTTLDYSINKLNTLYLTGAYTWRDDKENRFRLRHRARGGAGDLIYDANGDITGYNNGEVLRQTKGGINTGRNDGRRLEDQRVRSLALRGDHQWGKLKTNWSVQLAKASEKRPNERYVAMGRRGITVNQNISEAEYPLLTDNTPLSSYTRMDELTEQFQDQFERDINSRLDFSLPLSIVKN